MSIVDRLKYISAYDQTANQFVCYIYLQTKKTPFIKHKRQEKCIEYGWTMQLQNWLCKCKKKIDLTLSLTDSNVCSYIFSYFSSRLHKFRVEIQTICNTIYNNVTHVVHSNRNPFNCSTE